MAVAIVQSMPRQYLIRTSDFPYQITARTNNREWFQLPMHEVWNVFMFYLDKITKVYGFEIGSFVLMSNHIHMLVWTPLENLDLGMNYLLREVSKKIGQKTGRINHLFGGPYKRSLVMTEEYLAQAYRYNYQNALSKNLVLKAEDYEYSTLYYLNNGLELNFPLFDQKIVQHCSLIPEKMEDRIFWLNEKYSDLQREALTLATKKTIFKVPVYKQFKDLFGKR